jgi:hypothetical protein
MSTTEFMVKLHDAACLIVDATEAYLKNHEKEDKKWTWNPEKLVWTDKTGQKGPFQLAEDVNNPDFKLLLSDLADHGEHLSRDGYFYWTMQNGAAVGRKRRSSP